MLYIRKLFTQDLRNGKQIAFPKEVSNSFFCFDYTNNERDRKIKFTFKSSFGQFQEFEGKEITTRLYAASSESRMDGEVKAFIRDKLKAKVDDLLIFKNKGTKFTEFELMFVPKSNSTYYSILLNISFEENHSVYYAEKEIHDNEKYPLQQIFFGAPGTGKSHTINKETKGHKTFRTTFHPDSDYSTFVGSYKPVMEEVETRVVPVVLNNGAVFDQNNGTLKEKKISYNFVKQAFMKAYIAAWREYAQNNNVVITSQSPSPIALSNGIQTWILTEVSDDRILYTKEDKMSVSDFKNDVITYWPTMPDPDLETGKYKVGNFEHYPSAACAWYREKYGKEHSADECWETIYNVLEEGGIIEGTPNSQTYSFSLRNGDVVVVTRDNKATRKAIKGCYENKDADTSVQKRIAIELKELYANDFDNAWEELKKRVNGVEIPDSTNTPEIPPVFLIIEEINRGNCAQIFGDLFQLLDRNDNGFSQYPIHADDDIRQCLVSEHTNDDPSFGIGGLEFTEEQKSLINSVLESEYNVAEKIAHGDVLVFPPNLYIWATMNTSDQSLFPIDSAFKRRWDWKYIKITDAKKGWKIYSKEYDWWQFLRAVNFFIFSATQSEDKNLGYFFARAKDGIISSETFVSKVIFYLYSDVFKDYGFGGEIFKSANGEEMTFQSFYNEDGSVNESQMICFIKNVVYSKSLPDDLRVEEIPVVEESKETEKSETE